MCEIGPESESDARIAECQNLKVDKVQRDELIQYYWRRREALDFCATRSHHAIKDEKQEIIGLIHGEPRPQDDSELRRALAKLTGPIPSTSRNCLLIAVCCLLEDLLRRAGNLVLDDYDLAFKKDKQEHRENCLRTHRRVLETTVGIDFNPVKKQVALLDHAILIRNSVVHAWGKVETSTNPDRLREVLNAISWADETRDGYVALDDQAYPDVMIAAMELVEHVFEQLHPSE